MKAFNKTDKKLVVVGDGEMKEYLKTIAGPNVDIVGFKSDEVVEEYMKNCRAFVFPGEDDFGMAPVEAMSYGKPVLAYKKGGALETVLEGKTGEFFDELTEEAFSEALGRLIINENFYNRTDISKHANKFSRNNFEKKMKSLVKKLMK